MCPSSWKLYEDDFPFFGSSLARLEPEPELYEVWEINVLQIIINSRTPKIQMSRLGSRWAREEPKKKENHLKTISKMMGTLVQAQLYTFSSRMALYGSGGEVVFTH